MGKNNSAGDPVNLGIGLFQDCSKNSNSRAHKVTLLMWNAISEMVNRAGALRSSVHTEHPPTVPNPNRIRLVGIHVFSIWLKL